MITGSCLCGAVAFELDDGGLLMANNCHCSRCRKANGSEYVSFLHAAANYFRFTAGEDNIAHYESLEGNDRPFCKTCGSRVPIIRSQFNFASVPFGCLDQDPGIAPQVHLYVGSKAPWFTIKDDLPQKEELGDIAELEPYIEKAQRLAREQGPFA